MKQIEWKTAEEDMTIDGVPVTKGDQYMWSFTISPTPWQRFVTWVRRLFNKEYGKNGVYEVTKTGRASEPFIVTRKDDSLENVSIYKGGYQKTDNFQK